MRWAVIGISATIALVLEWRLRIHRARREPILPALRKVVASEVVIDGVSRQPQLRRLRAETSQLKPATKIARFRIRLEALKGKAR